ncbi:signal transduction histidine-protein kinase BaeS [Variovorax sp. SRS16]|uniref:hypothetical protein n=1 Tax=Variovorax sp. SRS16 TaxID=282217 RepID=UPI0013163316|nr:hypothetical protein [Variovorax sp. SRS16]VTU25214.1 signal transduction histidine-protein kinase BaeS [Variovorax sp. SRS16]
MDTGSIGLALIVVLVLVAFWRSLAANVAASASAMPSAVDTVRAPQAAPSRPEDLRLLLDAMSRSCGPSLHRGGIHLDIRLPREALIVCVAEDDMHALFVRIAGHASQVLDEGATLRVLACAEGSQAVVRWMESDTAQGRPQLAQFLDAKDRGLSASALACERIAHRHGGRIYAAPSVLGGLGLTLRLPLQGAAPPKSDAPRGNAPAPWASHALRSMACTALFSVTACQDHGGGVEANAPESLSTLAPIMAIERSALPIVVSAQPERRTARTLPPQLAGSGISVADGPGVPDN